MIPRPIIQWDFTLNFQTLSSSLRRLMRTFLTWLLVLGVSVGLSARVLASSCDLVLDPCCQEQHHSSTTPGDHHDGDNCPVEHHHQGCCSLGLLLGMESDMLVRLGVPGTELESFRHEGELVPDEPFLSLEKPPLI